MVELSGNLQTNRLPQLMDTDFAPLLEKLSTLENSDFQVKPFKQIIKLLEKKVNPIVRRKEFIWLESAQWCLDHKLIQQAYTQLEEGLLTHSLELIKQECSDDSAFKRNFDKITGNANLNIVDKDSRYHVKNILNCLHAMVYGHLGQREGLEQYLPLAQLLLDKNSDLVEVSTLSSNLSQTRNDINHAGFRGGAMTAQNLEKKIKEEIKNVAKSLKYEFIDVT
nr:TM1812 family CRISPR-associated protein [Nitritalea halalkaliphila]